MPESWDDYVTLGQASWSKRLFGDSRNDLWVLAKSGYLRTVRWRDRWLVHKASLEAIDLNSEECRREVSMYRLWININSRCYNRKNKNYKRYGGRGIRVHDSWKNDFRAFKTWLDVNLGPRPRFGAGFADLDRVDNDRGYEPDNVQWLNKTDHSHKTQYDRTIRMLTKDKVNEIRQLRANGWKIKNLANRFGVSRQSISRVLNNHTWRTAI